MSLLKIASSFLIVLTAQFAIAGPNNVNTSSIIQEFESSVDKFIDAEHYEGDDLPPKVDTLTVHGNTDIHGKMNSLWSRGEVTGGIHVSFQDLHNFFVKHKGFSNLLNSDEVSSHLSSAKSFSYYFTTDRNFLHLSANGKEFKTYLFTGKALIDTGL